MRRTLLTLLGIGLFGVALWYGARAAGRVQCEVCVQFKGHTQCRVGQGEDQTSAYSSAVTAACAVMAGGVTEAMQCNAQTPVSATCQEL